MLRDSLSKRAAAAFYATGEWRAMRVAIRERDGDLCRLCGRVCMSHGPAKFRPSVDHIVPLNVAPELSLEPSNLRVLCQSCNSSRRGKPVSVSFKAGRAW